MRVGSLKMTIFASFAHCVFRTFTYKATISRLVAFNDIEIDKRKITLNDYFALKFILGAASNGLPCSGFQTKLLGNFLICINLKSISDEG